MPLTVEDLRNLTFEEQVAKLREEAHRTIQEQNYEPTIMDFLNQQSEAIKKIGNILAEAFPHLGPSKEGLREPVPTTLLNSSTYPYDGTLSGYFASLAKQDSRYREPKEEPKVSDELITQTIEDTRIYNEAKEIILNAQRRQVAYGIQKYPEPLNADTWTTGETIDHIIDESIDKLHYLVMLKIKLGHEEAKKQKCGG